jgi:CRISPR/Cas system CSM-associated protein Csm3 (group 7 of RAMP superfamily)
MTISAKELSKSIERGFTKLLCMTISVEFAPDSFGHIGGSKSPLVGKDLPLFKIDDRPVIPGTSLKGAWRSRLEALLQEKGVEFASKLSVKPEYLKPCIPTTRPSPAESDKFAGKRWLTGCQIEMERDRIQVNPRDGNRNFVCPVCYFFGANGLQGFLRIGNLVPSVSVASVFDQTITSRDRALDGVRKGALASGEHIKGGARFQGLADLLLFDGTFTFGEARSVRYDEERQGQKRRVETHFDPWLEAFAKKQSDLNERRLTLVNEWLIPAFEKIDVLGGHRSKGGGRVKVGIAVAS